MAVAQGGLVQHPMAAWPATAGPSTRRRGKLELLLSSFAGLCLARLLRSTWLGGETCATGASFIQHCAQVLRLSSDVKEPGLRIEKSHLSRSSGLGGAPLGTRARLTTVCSRLRAAGQVYFMCTQCISSTHSVVGA